MSDLIPRLLEAIEEAERLAQEALEGGANPWELSDLRMDDRGWGYRDVLKYLSTSTNGYRAHGLIATVKGGGEQNNYRESVTKHIVRNDPSSVLRACQADRALVMTYSAVAEYDDWENSYEHATGRAVGLGEAVRFMADRYGITEEES